jgi:hypothetical protein
VEPTQSVVDEDNRKAVQLGVVSKPTRSPVQTGVSSVSRSPHPAGLAPFAAHTTAAHVVYTDGGWSC